MPCGGAEEPIDQQREQWTDGANAFAIAPGLILLYRRNRKTMEELAQRGWRILREEELVAGKHDLLSGGPAAITLQSQRAVARPRRPALHDHAARAGSPLTLLIPLDIF